jgi:hypothetical protein
MIGGTLYPGMINASPNNHQFIEASNAGISSFGVLGPSALNALIVKDDADPPDINISAWNTVKAGLEGQARALRNQFPNAHLYINLTGNFLSYPPGSFALPVGYDRIGLECYSGVSRCRTMFNAVKPLLPPNGRIWIIIPAWTQVGTDAFAGSECLGYV